jgi:hypothetical protein
MNTEETIYKLSALHFYNMAKSEFDIKEDNVNNKIKSRAQNLCDEMFKEIREEALFKNSQFLKMIRTWAGIKQSIENEF